MSDSSIQFICEFSFTAANAEELQMRMTPYHRKRVRLSGIIARGGWSIGFADHATQTMCMKTKSI
jgi:hypothetical protein